MPLWNDLVIRVLQSPAHRLLSNSTDVVRFKGRRSGRKILTPTQYVASDNGLVIFVGNPEDKTWWRNFIEPRDVDVLVKGNWHQMSGRVVTCKQDPQLTEDLLAVYLDRFPRARKMVEQSTSESPADDYTFVVCVPRD